MADAGYPKVSIIIPTLNAAALLDNCLASIAAQTYPKQMVEIVIADAFSKDATREIARRYGAVVIDDHGKNMEEGKRLALAHATGEFIVFVDADNELTHPDYLELAVRALQRHPNPARWDRFAAEASRIDRIAKGRADGDAWVALERLLLAIAEAKAVRLLVA